MVRTRFDPNASVKKSSLQFLLPTVVSLVVLPFRQRETHLVCLPCSAEGVTEALSLSLALHSVPRVSPRLKAMCHTDVEAPMVTNWFPYFLPTSLLFGSKRSKLLFSYLLPRITCFALSRKTYWFGEIRETDSLPWELQRRYATLP